MQDALEVGDFSVGDYAAAADALLQAYRSGHAEEVKQCVASRAAFLELDNQARTGLALHAPCVTQGRGLPP